MTGRSQLAQWCIKPAGAARTFLRAARRFVQWTRDRAQREAVAQALDYACWLDSGSTCSGRYRKRSSGFSKQSFASTRAKITGIVLAAPRLHESAERAHHQLFGRAPRGRDQRRVLPLLQAKRR